MKFQTGTNVKKDRLAQWADLIKECNNRPEGMSVDEWCNQNGMTTDNYYWRLRRVREQSLKEQTLKPTFVELKSPPADNILVDYNDESVNLKTVAIIKTGKCLVEVTDLASSEFLHNLIGALNNA